MELDFTQSLTLLLIGLLFFKETVLDWISAKFGFDEKDEEIPSWASNLNYHFNHETTEQNKEQIDLLKEIRDGQKKQCDKIDKTIVLLENQDKYGVKIRRT